MEGFNRSDSCAIRREDDIRLIKELRQVTENLDAAQEAANMGSWHYDMLEDKFYWSKYMFHILGLSFSNTPHTMTDILSSIYADDRELFRRLFEEFLLKKQPFEIDYRIIRPNGECRYIHQKARFFANSLGELTKAVGTIQDVTEQREAKIKEEQYRSLFDHNPDPVYSFDLEGKFVDCNRALQRLLGYTKKELLERSFLEIIEPTNRNEAWFRFEEARKGRAQRYELMARSKNGELVQLSAAKFPIIIDGEVTGVYGVAKDMTAEKRAQLLLMEAEGKFRSMVEDSIAGAYIIQDEKFVYANPQAKKILGISQIEGTPYIEVVHPDDAQMVEERVKQRLLHGDMQSYEIRIVRDDGAIVPVEIHGSRSVINGKPSLLGTFMDITERKQAADRNEYLAYHDYLTSLPNRRFLEERLEKQIISSRLLNEQFAVFYLDLDRFKYINDSLGHLIGDQLLKKVANRLKICVRKQDFVAHIAGDEFVLFLSNITKESAITRAKTLIRSLERPFYILNDELHITASIGISMYPEDGDERTVLMRNADAALYRAKALGKNNVQVYS